MNMYLVYLIMKLGDIQIFLGVTGTLLLMLLVLLRVIAFMRFDISCEREKDKKIFKDNCALLRKLYIIPVIMIFMCVFIPDSRTGAVLYILPKISHNKQVNKLPKKLVTLVSGWVNNQIKGNQDSDTNQQEKSV